MTSTDDQRPVVIPERIAALGPISGNLWWSWKPRSRGAVPDLDPVLYAETAHNPALFMRRVAPERLARAAADPDYLARYDAAKREFEQLLPVNPATTWVGKHRPELAGPTVAYFSAEFGVHPSLPIYSGGLGVLAGDHAKAASDLGLSLVGVSLLYRQGYLRQRLTHDGWQLDVTPVLEPGAGAHHARYGSRRPAAHGRYRARQPGGADSSQHLVRERWARPTLPAGYRCRGESRLDARCIVPSLRRRHRAPVAPGEDSGHRRRAPCAPWVSSRPIGTAMRGTPPSTCWSACEMGCPGGSTFAEALAARGLLLRIYLT